MKCPLRWAGKILCESKGVFSFNLHGRAPIPLITWYNSNEINHRGIVKYINIIKAELKQILYRFSMNDLRLQKRKLVDC